MLLLVVMTQLINEYRRVGAIDDCECLCNLWMPSSDEPSDWSSPVMAQDVYC